MPTINPRLNIVLEPKLYFLIVSMAKKHGVSMSLEARDLIKEALELHEDAYWDKEAEKRMKEFKSKKFLSHRQVWK